MASPCGILQQNYLSFSIKPSMLWKYTLLQFSIIDGKFYPDGILDLKKHGVFKHSVSYARRGDLLLDVGTSHFNPKIVWFQVVVHPAMKIPTQNFQSYNSLISRNVRIYLTTSRNPIFQSYHSLISRNVRIYLTTSKNPIFQSYHSLISRDCNNNYTLVEIHFQSYHSLISRLHFRKYHEW